MRRIIGRSEVPCPVCGAKAYEACIPINDGRQKQWPAPWHLPRISDAWAATDMMNALLGDDDE